MAVIHIIHVIHNVCITFNTRDGSGCASASAQRHPIPWYFCIRRHICFHIPPVLLMCAVFFPAGAGICYPVFFIFWYAFSAHPPVLNLFFLCFRHDSCGASGCIFCIRIYFRHFPGKFRPSFCLCRYFHGYARAARNVCCLWLYPACAAHSVFTAAVSSHHKIFYINPVWPAKPDPLFLDQPDAVCRIQFLHQAHCFL